MFELWTTLLCSFSLIIFEKQQLEVGFGDFGRPGSATRSTASQVGRSPSADAYLWDFL